MLKKEQLHFLGLEFKDGSVETFDNHSGVGAPQSGRGDAPGLGPESDQPLHANGFTSTRKSEIALLGHILEGRGGI